MFSLTTPKIFSVTELTRSIRGLLETEFPFVTVSGEISNLRQPYSGHLYFTLKDEAAQLKVVLFKTQQRYLPELPADGQQVICRGRISVYEPRGEYQLIVDYMERLGSGELQIAFEKLKQKLADEGLFEETHKKKIPTFPARIALVTSPEGAAVFDFLKMAQQRFSGQPIEIYPVHVQGDKAAPEICDALEVLNQRRSSEVVVLCRGGGSIEDLWPFNDERVARAIYSSEIPVISAIGHEIDYTIADFVADLRAPTPTAAAEATVPDKEILTERIHRFKQQLVDSVQQNINTQKHFIRMQRRILGDPRTLLTHSLLYLDNVQSSFINTFKTFLYQQKLQLDALNVRLNKQSPLQQLEYKEQWTRELARRLLVVIQKQLDKKKVRLLGAVTLLDAVSPLAVLGRGYAVVRSGPHEKPPGELIRSATQVDIGKQLEIILQRGKIATKVNEIIEDGRDERI
ncbi:MAG: exodeoxyribonuclease VII large subunit [Flavobacteriaceae bacterium]|nr:MAG: exodeoxyribonuclease VII large subunit [Flavobacteriaceae bacterium]